MNFLSSRLVGSLLAATVLLGCDDDPEPLVPHLAGDSCRQPSPERPLTVAGCLLDRGVIDQADHDRTARILTSAVARMELYRSIRGAENFEKGGRIARTLALVTSLHERNLLEDSARFHRIIDVVSVAIGITEGRTPIGAGRVRPAVTPALVWYDYPGIGAFFQPVTTTRRVTQIMPDPAVPTDTLLTIAEQLYGYALWRDHNGIRFPVWEYHFPWEAGGVRLDSPWISAMSQGLVMSVLTEAYLRTGQPEWKARAYEVLNSFKVTWSNGGVMLDDTTHGYWWEEFDPGIMIWNGSVQALVNVGFLWSVTQDTTVRRIFDRGVESLKYYTPRYDTGSWTLYSLSQGHNSVAYHNYQVALLDVLYDQTGDPWIKSVADRWREYSPPPGVN